MKLLHYILYAVFHTPCTNSFQSQKHLFPDWPFENNAQREIVTTVYRILDNYKPKDVQVETYDMVLPLDWHLNWFLPKLQNLKYLGLRGLPWQTFADNISNLFQILIVPLLFLSWHFLDTKVSMSMEILKRESCWVISLRIFTLQQRQRLEEHRLPIVSPSDRVFAAGFIRKYLYANC